LWSVLAIAGQVGALQLVVAGPLVRYQHFTALNASSLRSDGWAIAIVVLQMLLVAVAGRRLWRRSWMWTAQHLGRAALLALLVAAFTAVAVSRNVQLYSAETILTVVLQLVCLGNILLVVESLPAETMLRFKRGSERLLGSAPLEPGPDPGGVDRFALIAAVLVMMVATALNVLIYERHPHIPDEVSYLWQARYFARGWLTMPAPPVPEAFNLDLMTYEATRWYSPFPIGWPAALALGVMLGVPWLVNPMLTGVSLLLCYMLLRELYPLRTARLGIVLLACSPWFLFMGMNFMAHQFTLACALAAAIGAARARRTSPMRWAWLGGLAAGAVALARPLDGLLVMGLLGICLLLARTSWRNRLVSATCFAVGTILVSAISFPYNRELTGDFRRHPVMAYFDRYYGAGVNDLGFGADRGLGWTGLDPFPGHGWKDVVVNAQLNASAVNTELLGWGTGSLFLLAMLASRRKLRRSDGLMLAAALGVIGIQSLYWFNGGPDFGARYWYLIIVPCMALTARAIELLRETLENTSAAAERTGSTRALAGVLALCALALVSFFPWRAWDKYHEYRGMRADIRTLAQAHDFGRSIVFIRGNRHPDYASAAVYNPLDWSAAAPIYAWDREETRARVLEVYRDRPVWYVNGPTLTGRGYEIAAGPIPSGQASAHPTSTTPAGTRDAQQSR
jgi:4-amino-4-deoxy-L-arabinose transferase-like glycosyltransferase